MVSKSELQNAFIKKAILSKKVWLPIVLGTATMVVASGFPFWIGAIVAAIGVGSAIWRITIGRRSTEEAVVQQLREEANRQHYSYLRSLQRRLRRDRDPQTGKLLRQLRSIHKRMVESKTFTGNPSEPEWQSEVRDQMTKLYESSVGSLDRSFEIWSRAQDVQDESLRSELSQTRSNLLREVTASVERLGKALDQMQVSSMKTAQPARELSDLRQELEQGLSVAKNIEGRINDLNKQVRKATRPTRGS